MGEVNYFIYGFIMASVLGFLLAWLYLHHLISRNAKREKELQTLQEELRISEETRLDLEDRHQMISEIFDTTPNIIYVKNTRGQMMLVNESFVKFLGGKKEDYFGKTDFEYLPPLAAKAVRDNDARVIESQLPFFGEEEVPGQDGKVHIFHSIKFPIYDKHGKVYAIGGIASDITLMKSMEENLSIALAATGMGIFDWDMVQDKHYWSEGTKQLFGIVPNENFKLTDLAKRIHPDDVKMLDQITYQAISEGKEFVLEYRVITSYGYRWITQRARPYVNSKGEPIRLLGVCWDTTQAKNNEMALKKALEMREEFIKLVSHHIKTPLSSLKLRFQMTKRNIDRGDESVYSKAVVDRLIEATEFELDRLTKSVEGLVS